METNSEESKPPSNKPRYWIKLYIEILDDLKVGRLPVNLKWRFIECLLIAGDARADGRLPEIQVMAWRLRVGSDVLEQDLGQLMSAGLLSIIPQHGAEPIWVVSAFEKRQAASPAAKRMRAYRRRLKAEQSPPPPPLQSPSDKTDPDRTEEKTDADAYSNATVPVTPVTQRNPSASTPELPYSGNPFDPLDQPAREEPTGGDLEPLVRFWEGQTGALRPPFEDTREEQWLAPLRLLLSRVNGDQATARALLASARHKMLAQGKTPFRPAAVIPSVFAELDGLDGQPAPDVDSPSSLTDTIAHEMARYEEENDVKLAR